MNYFDKKRKYLIGSKKNEYIKDGLQLWLDGIENTRNGHNSSNINTWYDLSGNDYDFNIYNGTPIFPEENNLPFNGNAVYICTNATLQELMIGLKERTIEIVCSISDINSDAKTIFLGGKSGALNSGVGMWYSVTRGGMAVSGNSNCFRTSDITNPHTYSAVYNTTSINSTNFYQDGALCTSITGGTMASSYVMIGGRNYNGTSTYRFYGKIYCIRVYDRQLTQEEREHNRLIDIARFNLSTDGLTDEQIQAINKMASFISAGELNIVYDDEILDIGYSINQNGDLIYTDNTGLIDNEINNNEELEVRY